LSDVRTVKKVFIGKPEGRRKAEDKVSGGWTVERYEIDGSQEMEEANRRQLYGLSF